MTLWPVLIFTLAAYLVGSIPFGLIIAKAHGINLRSVGSGNIGATNVSRALGRKWAYFCFGLDVLKGLIPTVVTLLVFKPTSGQAGANHVQALAFWLMIGCAAIVGHIFPVYVRFKGGKGVATSFGVALGIWPYYTLCALAALAIWVAFALKWRYVSLASMAASVAFLAALVIAVALVPNWRFDALWPLVVVATVIPAAVFIRHRENIGRLINGTESRIRQKKETATETGQDA